MGLVGSIAVNILREHGVEPIPVKTPKYEIDVVARQNYNTIPVKHCIEILLSRRGLLLTFASGTRSKTMLEAEPGLNLFSHSADLVVPLTTVTKKGQRPTIIVQDRKSGVEGKRGELGGRRN